MIGLIIYMRIDFICILDIVKVEVKQYIIDKYGEFYIFKCKVLGK